MSVQNNSEHGERDREVCGGFVVLCVTKSKKVIPYYYILTPEW